MNNRLSLYIHIPFCVRKCNYCAFYSVPMNEPTVTRYFEALSLQIRSFSDSRIIDTVYFGGGTPSVLGAFRLCKLLSLLRERLTLAPDCEITAEVNPGTVNFDELKMLRLGGFNRLSVGVQSSNDGILGVLGRIHSFDDAKRCIADAHRAGFDNISADLMFGIPNMSAKELKKSVCDIMSTEVKHISIYSLMIEEGTPFFEKRMTLALPDEDAEEEQYELICRMMSENGYEHYEISSFCIPGFESRHNLRYWSCEEYFGFGAGAHSYYNGRRFSCKNDIHTFCGLSHADPLTCTDYRSALPLDSSEREEERIMLGLRTRCGALLNEAQTITAKRYAELGYGYFEGDRFVLNEKGYRVSNKIISDILFS